MVPSRGQHVRYPPGWPVHVKTRGSSAGPLRWIPHFCVAWTREHTWYQLGATVLDTDMGAPNT
eukprot:6714532-Pyramimonas_sp.AAC.1